MDKFQIAEYVVCDCYTEKVPFGTVGRVVSEYNGYVNVIFPGKEIDISVNSLMNKEKFDNIMQNGLTADQAIDALKEGKKIKFFRWKDSEYIQLIKGSIKLEGGLNFFVQNFADFRAAFNRSGDRFLIHGEDFVKVAQNISLNTCKECKGTGILDFGFYTRKCMKCFRE